MDTRRLSIPPKHWNRIVSLGSYYLFLVVNNLLIIPVGLGPDNMTRDNSVYTSRHAIGLGYMPQPKICHFSLKAEDAVVGFSTNIRWVWRQTPLWFMPSFTNAPDWSALSTRQEETSQSDGPSN
jgi:hypothetical protein